MRSRVGAEPILICRGGGEELRVCLITLTPPLEEGLFPNLRDKELTKMLVRHLENHDLSESHFYSSAMPTCGHHRHDYQSLPTLLRDRAHTE